MSFFKTQFRSSSRSTFSSSTSNLVSKYVSESNSDSMEIAESVEESYEPGALWPRFHQKDGTGIQINSPLSSDSPVRLDVSWRFPLSSLPNANSNSISPSVHSSPAIDSVGNLYVGSNLGILKLSPGGSLVWLAPVYDSNSNIAETAETTEETSELKEDSFSSSANLRAGLKSGFFQSESSPSTGLFHGLYQSSPCLGRSKLYAGLADGRLVALSRQTGSLKWTAQTQGAVVSSPAMYVSLGEESAVIVGSLDNSLYSFSTSDGTKNWRFRTEAPIYATPAIDNNGYIYFTSFGLSMHCLTSASSVVWSRPYPTGDSANLPVIASPTVTDSAVLIGTRAGVSALNKKTGANIWRWGDAMIKGDSVVASSAVGVMHLSINGSIAIKQVVYLSSTGGTVAAVVAATGSVIWKTSVASSTARQSMSVALSLNNVLYLGATHLIAIDALTGQLLSTHPVNTAAHLTNSSVLASSPAIGFEGSVYLGTSSGEVMAFGPPVPSTPPSFSPSKVQKNESANANSELSLAQWVGVFVGAGLFMILLGLALFLAIRIRYLNTLRDIKSGVHQAKEREKSDKKREREMADKKSEKTNIGSLYDSKSEVPVTESPWSREGSVVSIQSPRSDEEAETANNNISCDSARIKLEMTDKE